MIERRFAVRVFGHVFARNDGYVHHPAAAGISIKRRKRGAMPDTAVMHRQITGLYVEADLPAIGVVIDEVFLTE